jgi:hypothetical protein
MRICLLVLLLAGCASQPSTQYRWVGGNPATFDQDAAACEAQALSVPFVTNERGVAIYGACMRSRGWNLVER